MHDASQTIRCLSFMKGVILFKNMIGF